MISEKMRIVLQHYNEGLSLYRSRDWDGAIEAFNKALEADPQDGPSLCYIQRSREYKQTPPPLDWDGVFTMTTK
ncbi:MAG: tetratricopeptide repeat protein [Spirochaetes bacterium]|nr:tetratricopeptide repeat protein [Spirochaetota bacterium]